MHSSSSDPTPFLRLMQESQARAIRATSECVEVGPLLAGFDPTTDLVWVNYAVQLRKATLEELSAAVEELRPHFAARQRVLRFELSETLWPELLSVLERAGLKLQVRVPLMLCTRTELSSDAPLPASLRIGLVDGQSDDELLGAILALRNRSFGMERPPPTSEEIASLRQSIADEQERCAVAHWEGALAGVGSLMPGGPVSELVGVATDVAFRGRGVAGAISRFLAADHLDRGGEAAWLSAASEQALRVYQRIGFRSLGMQANYMADDL